MKNRTILSAAVGLAIAGMAGMAQAAPLSGTFTINVWNGDPQSANSAPSAVLPTPSTANEIASFAYTGPIDFQITSLDNTQNTFGNFFVAADISGYSSATSVSEPNFLNTIMSKPGLNNGLCSAAGQGCVNSYVQILGSFGDGSGTITHDDGASLYLDGSSSPSMSNPGPLSQVTDNANIPAGPHTFDLIYTEDNGDPSILTFDFTPTTVPEPTSLALLGAGLLGLGAIRRRRKAT